MKNVLVTDYVVDQDVVRILKMGDVGIFITKEWYET